MEEASKILLDKITSYNIFNNLFPGIVFCYILRQITIFNLANETWFENLFVYYFIGMILSRFGSVIIEPILQKWRITNKSTKDKEPFLKYASYSDYKEASSAEPFIVILSETNNTYRTIVAMLVCIIICKLYEFLIYSILSTYFSWAVLAGQWSIIVLIIVMFVLAYQKQTDYVRKSVEKHMSCKQKSVK